MICSAFSVAPAHIWFRLLHGSAKAVSSNTGEGAPFPLGFWWVFVESAPASRAYISPGIHARRSQCQAPQPISGAPSGGQSPGADGPMAGGGATAGTDWTGSDLCNSCKSSSR